MLTTLVALAAPLGAADEAPLERAVLDEVNAARRAEGRGPLAADPRLTDTARAYSCAMAREGFFDHTAPDGQTMGDRVRKAGLRYSVVGENIAKIESRDPAARAVAGWLKSPGHRENIMEPRFTHTGVGACRAGRAVYFTQIFARPR
ncbi:MAG TPA: CAP domain-containing protein [Terriglobales bacterium]|nr:CAP domain-containing protein [Terriglobales bacterium]